MRGRDGDTGGDQTRWGDVDISTLHYLHYLHECRHDVCGRGAGRGRVPGGQRRPAGGHGGGHRDRPQLGAGRGGQLGQEVRPAPGVYTYL